jgi:glutathione S-transferase
MYPYASLATLAALVVYIATFVEVGRARRQYGVDAPATDGPIEFQIRMRVQTNTLEQIVIALPAIWLCAFWVGDIWAGVGGGVWALGRAAYARGYYKAPKSRALGFVVAFMAAMAMLAAAAIAIIRA